jgi:predicted flavoprotein YhiN
MTSWPHSPASGKRSPIVVVGAGAAGLVAAIHAADGRRPVILLERTEDGGRKILISGGGRCNVLPSALAPKRFVTDSSPNTLRKILLSWPHAEQRAFFERRMGLALELEQETGKLFPVTHKARDVRDGLVRLAREAGVDVRFGVKVDDVRAAVRRGGDASPVANRGDRTGGAAEANPDEGDDDARWRVRIQGGEEVFARSVVLATGGLSVPATGSDGIGLRIARDLGHEMHDTYPALTPLTADPSVHAHLAGISLTVTISAPSERLTTTDGFLFTHRGYSGPSILDVSHVAVRARLRADEAGALFIRWADADADSWEAELSAGGSTTVGALLRRDLPDRLAESLLREADVDPSLPLSQLRRADRQRLVTVLTRYELPWTGDEGYKKAEVTGGGVTLSEVDPSTMESRRHPGLYLCGEMLDAFGPIGGHNFSWAFSTGWLAGRALAE